MAVINIRKDGTIIEDLSSIVITEAEFPEVFGIIDRINERLANEARSKEETA